jgi:HPt (histidine-containing phosphotransfer) domain-containing protein
VGKKLEEIINMEEQAIIDMPTYNQLKDLMGADFVVELIDTYNIETGELIEQLGQALTSGEAASFGRYAHSIKSSSASLGALELSQQARELEMMGKASDLSGAGQKVEKLAADFLLVKQRLEELRNES